MTLRAKAATAEAVMIVPARQGPLSKMNRTAPWVKRSPFGAFVVKGPNIFKIPKEWKAAVRKRKNAEEQFQRFDYALIDVAQKLQCPDVQPEIKAWPDGHWGLNETNTVIAAQVKGFVFASMKDEELSICGFPGDKACSQWIGRGPMKGLRFAENSRHNSLLHEVDNAKGMSGSPVWTYYVHGGKEVLALVGINSGSRTDLRTGRKVASGAVAITKTVWDRIDTWMNPGTKD